MRLRRSDPASPGYRRRRCGSRGFTYLDRSGRVLRDPRQLRRIRALAIPPAWQEVWICPEPDGHIQATGTDSAGRRQYLYHPDWRRRRDRRKFLRMRSIATRLPRLRRRLRTHLADRRLTRRRVLATAVRLLDLGLFRVGGDEYATGEEPTFGVATLLASHVRVGGDRVRFRYPAKGGVVRETTVSDPQVVAALRGLRRQRRGGQRLLAYRQDGVWREVRSDDINAYLREVAGCPMTAKDFRTWHATVRTAVALARVPADGRRSPTALRRSVARVMREVSGELGNTPAVLRSSYVDPKVVQLFAEGRTVPADSDGGAAERAVLDLLD